MSEIPKWRRRQYLINPEFQLTVMGFFIGLALVSIFVFYWAVRLIFSNFGDRAQELGLPPTHLIFQFIMDQQHAMNLIFLSTSVLLFIFLLLGGLLLSHHIAGPIYRLRMHILKTIESTEVPGDVQFRKNDFFPDLQADYNTLLEKMRRMKEKTGEIKSP